jgi:hypothetical protein
LRPSAAKARELFFRFDLLRTHRDQKIDAPIVLVKWYDWTRCQRPT